MNKIRRTVSFHGLGRKNKRTDREKQERVTSPQQQAIDDPDTTDPGYNPKPGKKDLTRRTSVGQMEHHRNDEKSRGNSSPSFYSSSVYSNPKRDCSNQSSDNDGWNGPYDYAIMSRVSKRKDNSGQSKGSSARNKYDYQDVYKDKQNIQTVVPQAVSVREISESEKPAVPNKKYEDEDGTVLTGCDNSSDESPPKITPVSGYLPMNPGKAVVRPIAFKPVVQSKVSPVHTSLSPDSTYEKPHTDDGYASQDSRSCSHNGTMRDSCENRPDSYENPPFRDAKPNDFYQITPSPSDCNAGDLELLLREKEREINILRKTMEVNEKVILQVSEDKRINWENQMKELAAEYHRRMRFQQERSSKAEQDFKDHISALQKDNQRLLNENQQLLLQRDRNALIQEQLKFTKQKTDELTNKLLESNRDREVLLQQLKESQAKISYFEEQITVVKAENMNLSNELDEARRMMKKQDKCESVTPVNDRDVNRLEILLVERDAQLASERQKFIAEKESWEQEKKLVLQYQKQLQSNYMQMCRRNSELESNISVARSPTTNNNNHLAKSYDKTSFKAQLDSKPESLC